MRLIDADELFVKWQTSMTKMKEPVSVMFTLAAMNDLQQAPEVEAIPIGFIKQKINLEKSFAEATYATVYWKELIALWDVQKGRYHE